MGIKDAKLRRRIVDLVEQIAGERQGLTPRAGARPPPARLPTTAHILTAL